MSWPLFHTLFLAQQPQCWMEAYNCRAAPSHLPLHLLFLWSFISAVWSYFALSLGRGHLSSHLPQAEDSSVHRAAGHVDPSKWGMLYLSQEKRQKMYAGDTDRALFLSHVKELHWIMFFKANNCHNWRWELHFSNKQYVISSLSQNNENTGRNVLTSSSSVGSLQFLSSLLNSLPVKIYVMWLRQQCWHTSTPPWPSMCVHRKPLGRKSSSKDQQQGAEQSRLQLHQWVRHSMKKEELGVEAGANNNN